MPKDLSAPVFSQLLKSSQEIMGLPERTVSWVLGSSDVNTRRLTLFRTAPLISSLLQQPCLFFLNLSPRKQTT